MTRFTHTPWHAATLLMAFALVWVAGCSTVTTPQSPGAMNVEIKVKDYKIGTSPVEMHFATTSGNTVQFVSGETVACNNAFMKYDSNPVEQLFSFGSYIGEVPGQPKGGTYTFAYTPAKADPITIPVQVIDAPVKPIAPANGATVPLPTAGTTLTLQYAPMQLANTTILAVLNDSRAKYTFTLPTSETGTITVTADQLKEFQPGPGQIALVRVTTSNPSGTPFHSVKVEYDNITNISVTWT